MLNTCQSRILFFSDFTLAPFFSANRNSCKLPIRQGLYPNHSRSSLGKNLQNNHRTGLIPVAGPRSSQSLIDAYPSEWIEKKITPTKLDRRWRMWKLVYVQFGRGFFTYLEFTMLRCLFGPASPYFAETRYSPTAQHRLFDVEGKQEFSLPVDGTWDDLAPPVFPQTQSSRTAWPFGWPIAAFRRHWKAPVPIIGLAARLESALASLSTDSASLRCGSHR